MRKNILTFMVIIVVALMIAPNPVFAIKPHQDSVDIYSEMVGYVDQDFAIPVFVLYDPPGDGSYARYEKVTSIGLGLKFVFLGGPFPVAVNEEVDTTFSTSTWVETSHGSQNGHSIIVEILRQRWELWYYMTPSREWYKLKLASSETTGGWGVYTFDNLPDETWVDDMTGTEGEYSDSRFVSADRHVGESFSYETSSYTAIGLGVKVAIGTMTFELIAQVVITTQSSLTVSYNYYDSDDDMSFYINSEAPLQGLPDLDGIGIWFDPGSI